MSLFLIFTECTVSVSVVSGLLKRIRSEWGSVGGGGGGGEWVGKMGKGCMSGWVREGEA